MTAQDGNVPPGTKYDGGKRRFTLLPWSSVNHVVDALEYGARKYAVNNWVTLKDPRNRYADAAMRHLTARLQGELDDPESGLPHLAHAVCCLLFLMWFDDGNAPSEPLTSELPRREPGTP